MDCPAWRSIGMPVAVLVLASTLAAPAHAQSSPVESTNQDQRPGPARSAEDAKLPSAPPSILDANMRPIDLPSALQLAGVSNPEILLARERITQALALRQLAVAQFLPSLHAGANFDSHTGPLQQAAGTIIDVNRGSLYFGFVAGDYCGLECL